MEERKPLEERKPEFIEPELIKYEEKLADLTAGAAPGYPDFAQG
jgi:hypothetical protein